MSELRLSASDDHVERLAHESDPVRAVVELIWNAIDAEAAKIVVTLDRGLTGTIDIVRVNDDGHGINSNEVESTFGHIGGSWKARSELSKNKKRRLHGKEGQGRLRAFALGSTVKWVSVSKNSITGDYEKIEIVGNNTNRGKYDWNVTTASETQLPGMVVTARNESQRALSQLHAPTVIDSLLSHFAPVLLNEATGISIEYDTTILDPTKAIAHDTITEISFGPNDDWSATLRIIEWAAGQYRAVHFGSDEEHFSTTVPGSSFEKEYAFSAYISWERLDSNNLSLLGFGDLASDEIGDLWRAVHSAIKSHFDKRRRERRREEIKRWKETGRYPYDAEPTSDAERAERIVFDTVSGALVSHIPTQKDKARLTLRLLRDAIRHDPERLTTVLHEVVSLDESDLRSLTNLLGETTLPAIIRSANVIVSRHKFLAALEHIIFDGEDSQKVGERDHLHRILENELWIFGEEYQLMSSERSLTDLLRNHLNLAGLPNNRVGVVRRWDGKTGRTDLHLAVHRKEHDRIRHLIVELKAPSVEASRKELDQIEDYASAILSNPAFASDTAQWDLMLIVKEYDDIARRRIFEEESDTGRFFKPRKEPGTPHLSAFVRRWRDIIDENKRRLEFMTDALDHDPSIAEGLEYVRTQYGDLLPDDLFPVLGTE